MLGNAENDEVPGIFLFHLGHEMSKCLTSGGGIKISGRARRKRDADLAQQRNGTFFFT